MAKNIKCSLNIYISLFDASRCQTHTKYAAKPMDGSN